MPPRDPQEDVFRPPPNERPVRIDPGERPERPIESAEPWEAPFVLHPYRTNLPSSASGSEVWDSFDILAPAVISDSGAFRMWYSGLNHNSIVNFQLGLASSPDGMSWTKSGDNPLL